jgi:hypothetical protein
MHKREDNIKKIKKRGKESNPCTRPWRPIGL